MISEDDFVQASIRHQVGDLSNTTPKMNDQTIGLVHSASSGMTLQWDHVTQEPAPFNGWKFVNGRLRKTGGKVNRDKVKGALWGIRRHAPDYSFFVDMADHRARSFLTDAGEAAPVFCFNRPKSKPEGKILWPLSGYQDLGTADFLGLEDLRQIKWEDKVAKVCWRGSAGGWARLGKYGRGRMIRMHVLLNKNRKGEFSDEETGQALLTVDRHRFIVAGFDHPDFDVGYTQFGLHDFDIFPQLNGLRKDRLSMPDQTRFKYLAVLPGADIGSNFYWVMNSSSLGFVMDTDYESFASVHFKPWEHYVPIRTDLNDLEQNMEWCDTHPKECKAMIANANSVCELLGRSDLREKILRGVVEEVGNSFV